MEIKSTILFFVFIISACTSSTTVSDKIQELYVDDFFSNDIHSCKTSDVELSHAQAREFFNNARKVDYKTIHDHYEIAPCYIAGPLKYQGKQCSWKIRPGSTGSITCGDKIIYFVCDDCFNKSNK